MCLDYFISRSSEVEADEVSDVAFVLYNQNSIHFGNKVAGGLSQNETLACDHPGLIRTRGEDHACATVPLHGHDGSILGSANVSFESPREFSDGDRKQIEEMFAACTEALVTGLGRNPV